MKQFNKDFSTKQVSDGTWAKQTTTNAVFQGQILDTHFNCQAIFIYEINMQRSRLECGASVCILKHEFLKGGMKGGNSPNERHLSVAKCKMNLLEERQNSRVNFDICGMRSLLTCLVVGLPSKHHGRNFTLRS